MIQFLRSPWGGALSVFVVNIAACVASFVLSDVAEKRDPFRVIHASVATSFLLGMMYAAWLWGPR